MGEKKTFIKVTNLDIYKIIKELKEEVEKFKEENAKQHNEIIKHQIATNGKVKLSTWIATTALTLILGLAVGLVVGYLSGGL